LNPYIGSLLAAGGSSLGGKKKISSHQGAKVMLSAKEASILRLISLGLSNKGIARELDIAPETVKSHAKRIFIKLSTRTRAEAVARGNELGLI
jgi:LuxR family maltose regulon positive regulatory protein